MVYSSARPSRNTNRLSVANTDELTRLCRKYAIPLPGRDLFSKWAIVRTTGVQAPGRDSIELSSQNPHAATQRKAPLKCTPDYLINEEKLFKKLFLCFQLLPVPIRTFFNFL